MTLVKEWEDYLHLRRVIKIVEGSIELERRKIGFDSIDNKEK